MWPGPLFRVELVTHTRRARHWVARVAYALVMLAVLITAYGSLRAWSESAIDIQVAAALAQAFFQSYIATQMGAVVFLTPAMVAGAISQEYERKTLDYLLASQLSDAEIVFGKLAARVVQVAFLLLVGLPILALAMMLGGISPGELIIDTAITLTSLGVVSAMSMVASVSSRRPRDAIARAYAFVIAWLGGPAALWMLLMGLGEYFDWPDTTTRGLATPLVWLTASQPFVMLFGWQSWHAWMPGLWMPSLPIFLAAHVAAAALLAWWSKRRLRRYFARAGEVANRAARRERRRSRWRPDIGRWPVVWKEVFATPGMVGRSWALRILAVLGFGAVLTPAAMSLVAIFMPQWNSYQDKIETFVDVSFGTLSFLSSLGLLAAATHAACLFTGERERDTWTSLIGTTLEAREIVLGKLAGALTAMRWPVSIMGLLWLVVLVFDPAAVEVLMVTATIFGVLAVFAAALGLTCSFHVRTTTQAIVTTMAIALFLSGGYLMCCVPMASGGEEAAIMLAPSIAFLTVTPYWEIRPGEGSHPGDEFILAIVAGVFLYIVAEFVLIASLIARFDDVAGRAQARPVAAAPSSRGKDASVGMPQSPPPPIA